MHNIDEISEVINAIRQISGVGICYYDLNSFFNYDRFGIKNNIGHYCKFCEKVRTLKNGRDSCTKSDKGDAIALARQYKSPFFFECHMGIRELVVPLYKEETLIGALFIGQCRIEGDDMKKTIMQNVKQMGGGEDLGEAYDNLPLVGKETLLNVGAILRRYFNVKILNNELLAAETVEDEGTLVERMKKHIDINYNFDITPQKVADTFYVNHSYASRVFSQAYGKTMNSYINELKIERAQFLLASTLAPIGNVAINSGFYDANYFSRIFKKNTGLTPKQYRQKNKKE